MSAIDDYLTELAPVDAAVVASAYDVALRYAPDAVPGVSYGMPALIYHGKPLLSVMRAKAHIGIYPYSPAAVAEVVATRPGIDAAKGTIRIPVDQPVPEDLLRDLVTARTAQIDATPVKRPARSRAPK